MFDFSSDVRLNKFSQLLVSKVNTNVFEVSKYNVWQLFLFSINELETVCLQKQERKKVYFWHKNKCFPRIVLSIHL